MEYMTIFLTLFLVLISGASALVQKIESHDKIQPTQMGIVLVPSLSGPIGTEKVEAAKKNLVARPCWPKNVPKESFGDTDHKQTYII